MSQRAPYSRLAVRREGRILWVELLEGSAAEGANRRLCAELEDLCREIEHSDDIRVLVLVYGNASLRSQPGELAFDGGVRLVSLVAELALPVIAALRGDVTGLSLELALACDIRIGVKGSCFGLPQLVEGSMPCAGGTQRLPRLVGKSKALEMILTGHPVDAEEAVRIGLIQHLVPVDDLMTCALKLASDIGTASPLAARFAKEALYSGLDLTLDQGMRMELDLYLLLFSTEDRVEGIHAFQQKRRPDFVGR